MICLWIVAILSIFAIGLGFRASINLRLVRYQRDRLKCSFMAVAGINKAIVLLEEDALSSQTKDYDTPGECGVELKGKDPKDIFSFKSDSENTGFEIGYKNSSGEFVYGFQDEASKVFLNGSKEEDKYRAQILLESKNIEGAQELSEAIAKWIGAEGQVELAKKEKFKVPEELLLVFEAFYSQTKHYSPQEAASKAQGEFLKIKELVSIYGEGKLNLNTASDEAISIVTQAMAKKLNIDIEVANTLSEKIIKLRQAGLLKSNEAIALEDLTPEETSIFDGLKPTLSVKSDIFWMNTTAKSRDIIKKIIAAYDRQAHKIIYWHEN
jgi:hypothetical protein